MVLNVNTEVSILPDRGKRMYCFKVICGRTKVTYEIQCDDEKSRHDWMLAINKVYASTSICTSSDLHTHGGGGGGKNCVS